MDGELVTLATAGATALVQQMAADGWAQVRDRFAPLFARGRGGEDDAQNSAQTVQEELEAAREEVLAARDTGDEDAAADVQAEWRSRLRRALRRDPELAAELRSVVDELARREPAPQSTTVYNSISGGVHYGPVVQAGSIGSMRHGTGSAGRGPA